MPSLFKELQLLDRPYVSMDLTIGGKTIPVKVRLPSAQEQDAIDAFYMDAYARAIAEKLDVKPGRKTSERDSMRLIYESRPKSDLIQQLVPTRQSDIEERAYELAGIDREYELRELVKIAETQPDEFKRRASEIDDAIAITRVQAREEIASAYAERSVEELAQIMADININLKATNSASQAREADALYYSVYSAETNERIFESPEEVLEELRPEKISEITRAIRFVLQKHEDLPFVSPDDKEQNGQPSSSNVSAADTKTGGKRTKTTRGNSKPSTTPAS